MANVPYNRFDGNCANCGRYIATQLGIQSNFQFYCRTCISQALKAITS